MSMLTPREEVKSISPAGTSSRRTVTLPPSTGRWSTRTLAFSAMSIVLTSFAPSTARSGQNGLPPRAEGGTATTSDGPVPPSAIVWPGIGATTPGETNPVGSTTESGFLFPLSTTKARTREPYRTRTSSITVRPSAGAVTGSGEFSAPSISSLLPGGISTESRTGARALTPPTATP